MSALTPKEIDHVAYTLEKLIQWARRATETEGVQFHGLHPVDSAETVLKFLKMKSGGELLQSKLTAMIAVKVERGKPDECNRCTDDSARDNPVHCHRNRPLHRREE